MMTYFDRLIATCEDFGLPEDEAAALGARVNAACEQLALS